jgi:hypothetical protein
MSFNPLSLLVLKFRGRSVAVLRDQCARYEVGRPTIKSSFFSYRLIVSLSQDTIAVAQRNFRSLQGVPVEDIVLRSTIPDYPEQDVVELSKEIWSTVSTVVHTVTIALESGASLSKDSAAVASGH